MFKCAHNNICNKSTVYVTGFIYGDPYFVFSDTFLFCWLYPRSKKQDSSFSMWIQWEWDEFCIFPRTFENWQPLLYVKECLTKPSFYKDPWKIHMQCPI
jgi:hypothetical protein